MTRRAAGRINRDPAALYFPAMASLLLILSVIAFSDNLFTDVRQPSNSDPKMVIHGLLSLGWMMLFAAQAWSINLGRHDLHRRLGPIGFWLGSGVVLSTFYVFYAKFGGWAAMGGEALANRLLMPVFAVCLILAYAWRGRPDRHKRLLLLGNMALLSPILARIYDPVFGSFIPEDISDALDMALFLTFLFGTWSALIGSLWVFDYFTIRRIHPVTLWASAVIVAINAAVHSLVEW